MIAHNDVLVVNKEQCLSDIFMLMTYMSFTKTNDSLSKASNCLCWRTIQEEPQKRVWIYHRRKSYQSLRNDSHIHNLWWPLANSAVGPHEKIKWMRRSPKVDLVEPNSRYGALHVNGWWCCHHHLGNKHDNSTICEFWQCVIAMMHSLTKITWLSTRVQNKCIFWLQHSFSTNQTVKSQNYKYVQLYFVFNVRFDVLADPCTAIQKTLELGFLIHSNHQVRVRSRQRERGNFNQKH